MSYFFLVCLSDAVDKCVNSVIFYDADCASSESAAGDAGTDHAGEFPGKVHKDVDLLTGYFIVIAQGSVRLVHKLPEFCDISCLQSCYGVDRALVFINSVFCPLQLDGICDEVFVRLEFFRSQIAQGVNIQLGLQGCESIRALLTPVIISGVYKTDLSGQDLSLSDP